MKNNISIEDLDNLLKANENGEIKLVKREIEIIEKLKSGDLSERKGKNLIKHELKILKEKKDLEEKLEKEFVDLCEKMKVKSQTEIIESAYEITVKEELKENLKNMGLYPLEVSCLLKLDNILNEFYKDWLDDDTPLGDVLENSIEESLATLSRYNELNNKER